MALLGQHAREHGDLDRCVEVLEDEHGHLVALLRELPGQVGDHTTEDDDRAVLALGSLCDAAVDLATQRSLDTEQRVVAHVQAEHLLLEPQPVGLVELDVGNDDSLVERRRAGLPQIPEQAHHTLVALTAADNGGVDDLLEDHQQAAPGQAQRVERPGLDERLDRALVEDRFRNPFCEIVERGEGPAGIPLGQQLCDQTLTHVADGRQTERDRAGTSDRQHDVRRHLLGGQRREVHHRSVDVGREHLHSHCPRIAQVHRRLVEVALHTREQAGEVLDRVVNLQVGGLVGDEAVPEGVALVEGVVGELLDDVEQLFAEIAAVAGALAPGLEAVALLGHQLADLLPARFAQVVGLGEGVPGELLRHAHHALLVDHQPVGVAQHVGCVLVEVRHRLPAVLAVGIVVMHVHAHRPRPVERQHGRYVLEARRLKRAQQGPHRGRFQLEHTHGVAPAEESKDRRVVERHRIDVEVVVLRRAHHGHGVGDDVEVSQAEEVHLQQAELLDAVHLVLRDDRGLCRVDTGLRLALDRQVLGERISRDHHCRRMDAVAALQALEALRNIDDLADVVVGFVHRAQLCCSLVAVEVLGVLLEAVAQGRVATHHERRHRLGDLVAHSVGVAEHACRVAHGVARLDGAEGDDLRDVVASVALGGVADHLVSVPGVEVHVDVGHRHATRVQESLEEQVVLDRVELGDPQAVRHSTSSGRPAARPDTDPSILGVLDEVPHDEEVAGEPHVLDDLELVGQPLDRRRRQLVAPALPGALPREVVEVVATVGEALGQRKVGELRLAELDRHIGPLGDPEGVVARLGHLAEQVAHLGSCLEVMLLALELEALRVGQQRAGLDAQQCVVRLVVGPVGVVRVVGGEQRRTDAMGDLDQLRVGLALCRQAMVLQLDEEVVLAEDLLQAPGLVECTFLVAHQQRLQHMTAEASGGGDQPVVVLLEQVPVDARLVVVALEEGQAGQLDEVPIALVGLGQQGEVVVELLSALGLAAGVVDPAAPHRSLGPVLVRHVRLGADDRLHALLAALLVELEGAVHVAVIGDPDRRLAVTRRLRHEFVEPGSPVEHRELGVDVEVGERVAHDAPFGGVPQRWHRCRNDTDVIQTTLADDLPGSHTPGFGPAQR